MPGTPTDIGQGRDDVTAVPVQAVDDLLDDLASDGGAPVPFRYGDAEYAARTRYTGAEVLELAAKLTFDPPEPSITPAEYEALSPADRLTADELRRAEINDAYNEWMIEQLAFVLAAGDARELWDKVGGLPASASNKLVRGVLRRTGLFNAEGEFLAP